MCLRNPFGLTHRSDRPQQGCGGRGGQPGGCAAGQQRPEQGVQLIHDPDPGLGQVGPSLIEQTQRIRGSLGLQRTGYR